MTDLDDLRHAMTQAAQPHQRRTWQEIRHDILTRDDYGVVRRLLARIQECVPLAVTDFPDAFDPVIGETTISDDVLNLLDNQ